MSPEKPTVSNQSLMKCVYFRIMKAQFVKNPVIFQIKCHMKSKVVTSLVHCVNTWIMFSAAKLGSQMKSQQKLAMKIVIREEMILQKEEEREKAHESSGKRLRARSLTRMRTLQYADADARYDAEAADTGSLDRYLTTAYTAPEAPSQKTEINRKAAGDAALFVNCRVEDDMQKSQDIMNFYNGPTGEDNEDGDTMPTCSWEQLSDHDDNETFGEFCEPELFELKYTKTITPSHKIFPKVNHIGAQNKSHDKNQNMTKLPAQS